MKAGRRPSSGLTEREQEIMSILWAHGPIFVREMLEYFPEPRPHVNTVSTIVRILEEKGHVSHETIAGSHQYYALTPQTEYRKKSMGQAGARFLQQFIQDGRLRSGRGGEGLGRRAARDNRYDRAARQARGGMTLWHIFSHSLFSRPSPSRCCGWLTGSHSRVSIITG